MTEFRKRTEFDVSAEELFQWHARPGAFERLKPPWETMKIVERTGSITDGSVLKFKVYQGPVGLTWEAHHEGYEEGRQFRDVQARGPFASWAHTHRFVPAGEDRALLDDHVTFRLPLHPISWPVAGWFVRRMLLKMFDFRHERTMHDMTRHKQFEDRPRQDVAITGASGMIGEALTNFLTTGGHSVTGVTRNKDKARAQDAIHWQPRGDTIEAEKFEGKDVVVHLAGETINQRWTDEAKRRVMESRREGTRLLSKTLASLNDTPRVLVSASAIGFYGDRDDEVLTEESAAGEGFLADVCKEWEAATQPARDAGIRVVNIRIGIVLDPDGGALEQMLLPFKMGVGGRIGDGTQYMSWIALDDLIGAIHHCMFTEELEGPVNLTAPNPTQNKQFTKVLGKVLSRPTLLPVPKLGLKAILGGEAAEGLLYASQRVLPKRLQESGFEFFYPDLEPALRHMLGK